jgi:hypothetical protein
LKAHKWCEDKLNFPPSCNQHECECEWDECVCLFKNETRSKTLLEFTNEIGSWEITPCWMRSTFVLAKNVDEGKQVLRSLAWKLRMLRSLDIWWRRMKKRRQNENKYEKTFLMKFNSPSISQKCEQDVKQNTFPQTAKKYFSCFYLLLEWFFYLLFHNIRWKGVLILYEKLFECYFREKSFYYITSWHKIKKNKNKF